MSGRFKYVFDFFSIMADRLDMDGDGVLDADEEDQYGSSPFSSDTDCDGIMDGEEIELGLNPSEVYNPVSVDFGNVSLWLNNQTPWLILIR